MVKRWGQTDKKKPRYGILGIQGTIDTQNSAELQNAAKMIHTKAIYKT